MSEGKKGRTILELTEDEFKFLLSSSFEDALKKISNKEEGSKKEKEERKMSIEEVAKHIASCPECSKPLNEMIASRFDAFKSEIEKLIEEKVKSIAKKEEKRGGLFG